MNLQMICQIKIEYCSHFQSHVDYYDGQERPEARIEVITPLQVLSELCSFLVLRIFSRVPFISPTELKLYPFTY